MTKLATTSWLMLLLLVPIPQGARLIGQLDPIRQPEPVRALVDDSMLLDGHLLVRLGDVDEFVRPDGVVVLEERQIQVDEVDAVEQGAGQQLLDLLHDEMDRVVVRRPRRRPAALVRHVGRRVSQRVVEDLARRGRIGRARCLSGSGSLPVLILIPALNRWRRRRLAQANGRHVSAQRRDGRRRVDYLLLELLRTGEHRSQARQAGPAEARALEEGQVEVGLVDPGAGGPVDGLRLATHPDGQLEGLAGPVGGQEMLVAGRGDFDPFDRLEGQASELDGGRREDLAARVASPTCLHKVRPPGAPHAAQSGADDTGPVREALLDEGPGRGLDVLALGAQVEVEGLGKRAEEELVDDLILAI